MIKGNEGRKKKAPARQNREVKIMKRRVYNERVCRMQCTFEKKWGANNTN